MTEPKPIGCTCDFSSGTRGMDRCYKCDGTGSRLLASAGNDLRYFPNTREGWVDACKFMCIDPDRSA